MKKLINLGDLRSADYDKNGYNAGCPCLICGKDVTKIEKRFTELFNDDYINNGKQYSDKTKRFMQKNYIHMDTDGNLYYFNEDVAEGHESQGCFPVGCDCMKKYRQLRASMN